MQAHIPAGMHVCVWGGGGGGGSTGGLVVGTPVYNTSDCEIDRDPQQCSFFLHHHPAVPSLYKARVDKPLITVIITVVAQVGLGCSHH